MVKKTGTVIYFLLIAVCNYAQRSAIIPLPKFLLEKTGSFTLSEKVYVVYADNNLRELASYAIAGIKEMNGVQLQSRTGLWQQENAKTMNLIIDTTVKTNNEGYWLEVKSSQINIKANGTQGLFYGIQTLLQLLPQNGNNKIPCVEITDEPRFTWRGMLFDNCRHMFSVAFIKKFIDQLAFHKLNKLHLHLTDDQGWRIEIKKYPKLQEIAAYRNGTQFINDKRGTDSIRYGGYYTQEQIKEIVAYASSRYVEVIPEIEMPGHSVAAITAYPYLACNTASFENGKPFEVRKNWGVSKDLYCAGNDTVFTFLQDVLTEVMQLFPSKYIHIGGDEAPHDAWKKCHRCQKRIKAEGLKDEAALQSWFIRRIEKFINANGKHIIGWEEIMLGGVSQNATVQSWLGVESGLKAARQGNDVILSPYSHLYFDGYQAKDAIEPRAIGYWVPLDTVYVFEPIHPDLTGEEAKHILGAQANLWTEFIDSEAYFEYMVYPRIAALSEMVWTPKSKKNFTNFKVRLQMQYQRYAKQGLHFRVPTPEIFAGKVNADSIRLITLINPAGQGIIRYSTDGSTITLQSPVYTKPVTLSKDQTIWFALFFTDERKSSTDFFPSTIKK